MHATVSQSTVSGSVVAPPSKSYTHRAIFAGAYGDETEIHRPLVSADTRASMRAAEAFGAQVEQGDGSLTVTGFGDQPAVPADVIDCANSGTTIRLAMGVAGLVDGATVLTGDESLRSRPQGPMLDAIDQLGGHAWSTRGTDQAPIVVEGWADGGTVRIPGDVSSQFITSLLMAGARTDSGIEIALRSALKSGPYVDITIDVLAAFGVAVERTDLGFVVPGEQAYKAPADGYTVPGDFSAASYLLAAGAIAGGEVTVEGLFPGPQGDSAIVEILDRMGADIDWDETNGQVTVSQSGLSGITVDVGDTPDLLPTIAVLGAAADGTTTIENCEHVRYKETDRVAAMAESLERMGVTVTEERDTLTIHGGESELTGATLDGRGDHRIVMSLAVAGLVAEGETRVSDAADVAVSFPAFFDVLDKLGANLATE
ncbi:3-phosphoshikimate 1-carboxyvinyltransferase [Halodesulfurarchaeum sp. HSR-GB]|uniref:3-phosphoshikimate 1-carboxyvinyltransferase n=1 Tax=Halodesulfurarchaeum sp. HSR-GB TaxID=3074077 RepID=UPI0028604DB0|nr:3-phosphoshikimate 1-carboxyvinyltransferase [Halodesulfurarchaeum sp. HSR-GB]MDR5657508.1 3-phosphoshikimate 1-carboxyvinyltransferase [Halodesulfurarchaeum sp. HSR-GB]